MGCRRKAVWNYMGFIGCLGQESMVEKRRGLGDFGRKRSGKTGREKGLKGAIICK